MDEITLFFIKIFKYKQMGVELTQELVDTLLQEAITETAMQKYTTMRGVR